MPNIYSRHLSCSIFFFPGTFSSRFSLIFPPKGSLRDSSIVRFRHVCLPTRQVDVGQSRDPVFMERGPVFQRQLSTERRQTAPL